VDSAVPGAAARARHEDPAREYSTQVTDLQRSSAVRHSGGDAFLPAPRVVVTTP